MGFKILDMAKNKKSFILYCDQKEMFEHLPPELCKQLLLHLFSYVNDENPDSDDPILNALFAPIKHQLKRDLEKWESNVEQRRQAGIKSAEARKAKANEMQRPLTTVERDSTKSTDTVNVNDTVNGSDMNKYIYSQFYDSEIKKTDNPKYEQFVKYLFGNNKLKIKLSGVLSITNQLKVDDFEKVLESCEINKKKIGDIVTKIENDKK